MKTENSNGYQVERVMLVDDSRIDNFINHKVLQKTGFAREIEVFNNAENAIKHLKNGLPEFPDLILIDAVMPKVDGFDFIEALRDFPLEVKENMQIIVLSNLLPNITMRKMILYPEVGMWMQKPLLVSNVSKIAAFINERELSIA